MSNRYVAVAKAYWASRWVQFQSAVLVLFMLTLLTDGNKQEFRTATMMAMMVWAWIPIAHFAELTRQQFASPAARLLPHFARYHLTVAAMLVGVVWLSIAGALAIGTPARFIGAGPAILIVCALVTLGSVTPSQWCFGAMMLVIYVPLFGGSVQAAYVSILRGDLPIVSGLLLIAGVIMFIASGRALLRMSSDEHASQQHGAGARSVWAASSVPANERQQAWFARSRSVRQQSLRLKKTLASPIVGLWRESQRLRIAAACPLPVGSWAVIVAGCWLVSFALPHSHVASVLHENAVGFMCMFATMAAYHPAAALRKCIGKEILMPVGRRRLLAQAGLVFASHLLQMWAVIAIAVIGLKAISSPTALTDPHTWYLIGVIFSAVPIILGATALVNSFRNENLNFAFSFFCCPVACVLAGLALKNSAILDYWPVVCGTLLLGGAMACCVAYLAWLQADLA